MKTSSFTSLPDLKVVVLLGILTSCGLTQEPKRKPQYNVVFILVDDLGWKDVGVYGSDFYQTPNVDQFASEGLLFTNGYAACTVCSPTRAAIMTGKYPATINCTDWIEGWKLKGKKFKDPNWTMYMDTAEYSLADAFENSGYETIHIGKWHLGEDSVYWPENQGFDVNIAGWRKGAPNRNKDGSSNGYFPPFGNPRLEDNSSDEYLTERLTDEAVSFIKNGSKKPFFLNFWLYNVHTPLQAKEEKVEKYKGLRDTTNLQHNPTYAAMVEHMDDAVGRIIQTLKDEGLYEETIIIFTSDNGGLVGRKRMVTNNSPLRSGKGDIYEGGVRVPLIIKAPGMSGGIKTDIPAISMDFYPTLMELLKLDVPEIYKKNLEGEDLTRFVQREEEGLNRDLFWHYPHYHIEGARPYSAIRSGKWKLIYHYENENYELFDLENDLSETIDVSSENVEVKAEMIERLQKWKEKVSAQDPVINPDWSLGK